MKERFDGLLKALCDGLDASASAAADDDSDGEAVVRAPVDQLRVSLQTLQREHMYGGRGDTLAHHGSKVRTAFCASSFDHNTVSSSPDFKLVPADGVEIAVVQAPYTELGTALQGVATHVFKVRAVV